MVYRTRSRPNDTTLGSKAIESHSVEEILQSDYESSLSDVEDVPMPSRSKVTNSNRNPNQKVLEIEAPPAETVRQSAPRRSSSTTRKRVTKSQVTTDNSVQLGNSATNKRSSRTRRASPPTDTNVEDPLVDTNIATSDDKIMSNEEAMKQQSPQTQAEKPTSFEEDVVDYELTSEEGEVHEDIDPQLQWSDGHDDTSLTAEPLTQKQLWEERVIREGMFHQHFT